MMADYRQIHMQMWSDAWFAELEPEAKLLWVYLFSNLRTSVSGLYELPLRFIAFETGIDRKTVQQHLNEFEAADKIMYDGTVMWIKTMQKYNATESVKVKTRIEKDVERVSDCDVKIAYLQFYGAETEGKYPIREPQIPYPQNESETETETETEQETDHEEPAVLSSDSAAPKSDTPAPSAGFAEFLKGWGVCFPEKAQPRPSNKTLQRKFDTRIKSPHFRENWKRALIRGKKSTFLNKSNWFDAAWFLQNDHNYEKILNGKYDDSPTPTGSNGTGSPTPPMSEAQAALAEARRRRETAGATI